MSGSDIAFDNFLAKRDPTALERERFGPPAWAERPGGVADSVMRAKHQLHAEEVFQKLDRGRSLSRLVDVLAVAAASDRESFEIAAYARRKRA